VTVEGGTGTCTTPVYPDNNGCGAIYKLEESVPGVWDESLAFSFADVPQGWSPIGPLTGNGKGTFYGVTYSGGAVTPNGLGKGTAYRLVLKDGEFVFTQLHIFNGGFDAESPDSPLVIGAGNQLFGASSLGSTGGLGSIFNVQPPLHPWGKWSVSMIAPFSSAGAGPYYPEGKIIMDGSGRIYGVTPSGGKNNKGTIYMVNP
jgi:hypothetical protein